MDIKNKYISLAMGALLMWSCNAHDDVQTPADDEAQLIRVGGVTTADMTVTATTRADATAAPGWLNKGLNELGMNMVYDLGTTEQYALLTYDDDGSSYSMNMYDSNGNPTIPAKWLGNGAHVFRGAYVPKGLRVANTTKTYTDLEQYTSLPPKKEIYATIEQITIPTQHRLARVVAYVLIDNSIMNFNGDKTKLKGYDADATHADNTKLRFCNVDVLDSVDTDGHPIWKTQDKVIPHFIKEEDITIYQETGTSNFVFPTDDEYESAKENSSKYTAISYGTSPCYDIIVRPTYTVTTNKAMVMGDELDAYNTDANKNKIDFELTLENGLEYEKTFTFDLNANDETVVYLRVSPEKIDYNSTGSRLWKTQSYDDKYYGVDNSDHELSMAGSSWQRAYTIATTNPAITDGSAYSYQYITESDYLTKLSQAYAGGTYDGCYFILKSDLTIDLSTFADIVFTGHLDALDHTITLTNTNATDTRKYLFKGLGTGWNSEVLNTKIVGGTLFNADAEITGHVSNCWNDGTRIADVTPNLSDVK